MRRIKRNFIKVFMIVLIISSMSMIAYAANNSYTYSNGYVMEYSLTVTGTSSTSGGLALTSTDDAAVAFVSIFGYKSSGSVACSGSKYQDFTAYISKTGSSVVKYTSHHSLVDESYKPYGTSISKTVYTD